MERRESAFRKSWLPSAKVIVSGLAATAIGTPIFIAGFSGRDLALLIFGAAMAVAGPLVLLALPFMKRGGYGACPVCQSSIEVLSGSEQDLLCGGCGSYLVVDEDHLVTIPHDQIREVPTFAVPTPWPDIRRVVSSSIDLSLSDYLSSVVTDAIMKDKGVRVMEPNWPPGCCVCAAPATRKEQLAWKVRMAGSLRDSQAELIVRDTPYCDHHDNGIDFRNVTFASRGHSGEFAMRFRSHAFREAFRERNPWKWESMAARSQNEEAIRSGSATSSATRVIVRCPHCQQQLRVPTGQRGLIRCPGCRERFEAAT